MKQQSLLVAVFNFSNKYEIQNKQNFVGLNYLSCAQKYHSKPQTNMHCYLQLKLYGKQQSVDPFLDAQHTNDVIIRKEQVKSKTD